MSDRFIIDASAPARVAAYLLPFTRDAAEPEARVAGIPGLRLVSATDDSILMEHLPTDGQLVIGEKAPTGTSKDWIAKHLELELHAVLKDPWARPLFHTASMTDDELNAYVPFHRPSALLSALAARIGLWWERGAYTSLRSDRRNVTIRTLSWREWELSVAELLNRVSFRIHDSRIVPAVSENMNPYLFLGDESIELDWRVERRRSVRDLLGLDRLAQARTCAGIDSTASALRPARSNFPIEAFSRWSELISQSHRDHQGARSSG